jgi:hypothetical protein
LTLPVLVRCEDGTKQTDLKKDGGKRIDGRSVTTLGALNGNAEPECRFREAVVEQDYACNDFHRVTFDSVEDSFDVMNKDDGVLKRMEFVGRNTGSKTESSEDAGQASYIDRHAEVAPEQSARVGAICREILSVHLGAMPAGYDLQTGITANFIHADTYASARSRVQTCKKEIEPPRRSEASALAHGAHSVLSLPARRSQMFPQRSQYFSSMFRSCNGSDLVFIVHLPPAKKIPATGGEQSLQESDSGQASHLCQRQGSIFFRRPASRISFIGSSTVDLPSNDCYSARDLRSGQSALVFAGKVTFFVTRLQDCAVLNDNAKTTGEV